MDSTAAESIPTETRLGGQVSPIPVVPFGIALSLFFVISYLACVGFYLLFPPPVLNHALLVLFLPGFESLTWPSFMLGLAQAIVYGWYIALVFGPLFNHFVARNR